MINSDFAVNWCAGGKTYVAICVCKMFVFLYKRFRMRACFMYECMYVCLCVCVCVIRSRDSPLLFYSEYSWIC